MNDETFEDAILRLVALRGKKRKRSGKPGMLVACPEFCAAAVDLSDVYSAKKVARALAIGDTTIADWRRALRGPTPPKPRDPYPQPQSEADFDAIEEAAIKLGRRLSEYDPRARIMVGYKPIRSDVWCLVVRSHAAVVREATPKEYRGYRVRIEPWE